MSFILEALKKSDHTRQDGTVPKLETVHKSVPHTRNRGPKWLWLSLTVLILNAALLLWLFGPWQQASRPAKMIQTPPIQLAPPAEAVKPQSPGEVNMAATPGKTPSTPIESPANAIKDQSTASTTIVGVQQPPSTLPLAPLQAAERIQPQPAIINPTKQPLFNAEPDDAKTRIYLLTELPQAIRRDIPEMHMSMHAFYRDRPAANLVRINGQILRTGALVSENYLLEEITSEGAVFLYAGYRFLVPRKNLRH